MGYYKVSDNELSGIANAIRIKGGTSAPLVFPSGFESAISAIPTGSGVLISKTISSNGIYNPADDDADAYSQVVVNVSGGGGSNDNFYIAIGVLSGIISDSTITVIPAYAFTARNSSNGGTLDGIDCPEVSQIRLAAFQNCWQLSFAKFPKCELVENQAFGYCSELTSVSLPSLVTLAQGVFQGCYNLSELSLPNCEIIQQQAFDGCLTIKSIYAPKLMSITGNSVFRSCKALESLYLLSSSVVDLANTNAFAQTPMSISTLLGYFGSIYVPSSLVSDYKVASRWSTYADRITSYVEE